MQDLIQGSDWYRKLIEDIRQNTFTKIIEAKHYVGKRILQDLEKLGKPEYGSKRIENIAKDIGSSRTEIYYCIQFAEKYPESELSHIAGQFSWRDVRNKLLPASQEKKKIVIPPLPDGKYNIIYADPPWQYYIGGYKNQSQHYDTIPAEEVPTLEDPKGKQIGDLAADDCLLFLWTTFPILNQIFAVIEGWGFQYSSCAFVWVKSKKDGTGFFFGNGNWTRANVELCLLGHKGKIARSDASISQIIYEPSREHSLKPDCIRDKIIQLVGDLPRIELFARQETPGWKAWGNEV